MIRSPLPPVAAMVVVLCLSLAGALGMGLLIQHHEITIDKMWTVAPTGFAGHVTETYLVVDDDGDTYYVDSVDLWSKLEVGGTCNVTTAGARVPFLSMCPTITEIEEV